MAYKFKTIPRMSMNVKDRVCNQALRALVDHYAQDVERLTEAERLDIVEREIGEFISLRLSRGDTKRHFWEIEYLKECEEKLRGQAKKASVLYRNGKTEPESLMKIVDASISIIVKINCMELRDHERRELEHAMSVLRETKKAQDGYDRRGLKALTLFIWSCVYTQSTIEATADYVHRITEEKAKSTMIINEQPMEELFD